MDMNFKEYMEYRADQDCEVGVIAFDILDKLSVPYDSSDALIFSFIENYLKDKEVIKNWNELKSDYLKQLY